MASPAAAKSLRQGSVLDVLCPQSSSAATVSKPAESRRMLNCELISMN